MLNIKSIGLTVAAAAVAAGAFSAAPANADPIQIPTFDVQTAWAVQVTPVSDRRGGGVWIATLKKGQKVIVQHACDPSTWCQVWSAGLDNGQTTGWVAGNTLFLKF